MFSQQDDSVLTLLATTIFADKRVFAKEIEMFLSAAQSLPVGTERSAPVSQSTLLLWFEANRDELSSMHERDDFQSWITAILDDLADYPHHRDLLSAMHDVARADGQVHISETALAALCARHWGLRAA